MVLIPCMPLSLYLSSPSLLLNKEANTPFQQGTDDDGKITFNIPSHAATLAPVLYRGKREHQQRRKTFISDSNRPKYLHSLSNLANRVLGGGGFAPPPSAYSNPAPLFFHPTSYSSSKPPGGLFKRRGSSTLRANNAMLAETTRINKKNRHFDIYRLGKRAFLYRIG